MNWWVGVRAHVYVCVSEGVLIGSVTVMMLMLMLMLMLMRMCHVPVLVPDRVTDTSTP
jgi:hypothetical protein